MPRAKVHYSAQKSNTWTLPQPVKHNAPACSPFQVLAPSSLIHFSCRLRMRATCPVHHVLLHLITLVAYYLVKGPAIIKPFF
jgi:hypothetical protein